MNSKLTLWANAALWLANCGVWAYQGVWLMAIGTAVVAVAAGLIAKNTDSYY